MEGQNRFKASLTRFLGGLFLSAASAISFGKRRFKPPTIWDKRRYDMNGRSQMQEGLKLDLLRLSWLEIWKNHLCPSMGLNGGSVAMDSVVPEHYLCTYTSPLQWQYAWVSNMDYNQLYPYILHTRRGWITMHSLWKEILQNIIPVKSPVFCIAS